MKAVRVLLDCDEVLCQFHGPAVALAEKLAGRSFPIESFTTWDLFDALPREIEPELYKAFAEPGFCASLPPYEDAIDGVKELRALPGVEVFVVTSPVWSAPTWVYERTKWLEEHFGFDRKHVVHTAAKKLVEGDVFVDDRPENVRSWAKAHPYGNAFLWDRVFNRSEVIADATRVSAWHHVVENVGRRMGAFL